MKKKRIVIIGGGIVGLATARALLLRHAHLKLTILEKEASIARHQTGHNSGVIHSGIYYEPGSSKARLCVDGARRLYKYCEANDIPVNKVGKIIVATDSSEHERLDELYRRGKANGVPGIEVLDADGIRAQVPACVGSKAIYCPSTGIVDFKNIAYSYLRDIQTMGGKLITNFEVSGISDDASTTLITSKGSTKRIETDCLISCAGVYSDRLAKLSGGKPEPKIIPFRGDYLVLQESKKNLVGKLIYPVPDPSFPFLGVHFTPQIDGSVWLGPNAVLAFSREGYSFSQVNKRDLWETLSYRGFIKLASRYIKTGIIEMYRDLSKSAFVKTLQCYITDISASDCLPGPSGIRAQALDREGNLCDDFIFESPNERMIHVRNAPSPGATSSLAIGDEIADKAAQLFRLDL